MSNVVVISGKISDYGPKLRPLPSGKWELNFTLCCDEPGRDGQVYTTYAALAKTSFTLVGNELDLVWEISA